MVITIGDALKSRQNNFDAIRLFAAFAVLYSHSFAFVGQGVDTFMLWLGFAGGEIGVGAFFVISGFLVTASVLNRDTSTYFKSRALRILPALLAVVFLTTFCLGPIMTTLPIADYIFNWDTFAYLKTATIFGFRNSLPGVFLENKIPLSVNGSLWTLPVEVLCYLCLPWLRLTGLLKPGRIIAFTAAMAAAAYVMYIFFGISEATPYFIARATPMFVFWKYAIFFLFGSIFYIHRSDIPLNGGFALICVVILFAVGGTTRTDWAFVPAMSYLIFYVALAKPCTEWLSRDVGDISYGTYIWAFPIQQTIVSVAGPSLTNPILLTVIATPIVLFLAWVSWHMIERPALAFRTATSGNSNHPPRETVAKPAE